jgi:hypothetical protein
VPADLIISHVARPSGARRAGASPVTTEGPALKGFLSLVVSLPGFRVDGVQEDAMTTAALAEKGQVGFAKLMRWLDGSRVSVLYLGQARTARFALIDLEPGWSDL